MALIRFAVTAKLICVIIFAYAKCWFLMMQLKNAFIVVETRTVKIEMSRKMAVFQYRFMSR